MKRIAIFTMACWAAAAVLYVGRHSVALMSLSGVIILAALDFCQSSPAETDAER